MGCWRHDHASATSWRPRYHRSTLEEPALHRIDLDGWCAKPFSHTHSLDSFFLTVVPKASSASGTGCPASRSTLISSPARGLSVSPLKKVCARPALQRVICSGLGHAHRLHHMGTMAGGCLPL